MQDRSVQGTDTRVPVECAVRYRPVRLIRARLEASVSNPVRDPFGHAHSPFPYAARNEVQIVNGMPCRTVLVEGTNTRVPVDASDNAVFGVTPDHAGDA